MSMGLDHKNLVLQWPYLRSIADCSPDRAASGSGWEHPFTVVLLFRFKISTIWLVLGTAGIGLVLSLFDLPL